MSPLAIVGLVILVGVLSAAIGAAAACITLVFVIVQLARHAPALLAAAGRIITSWISQAL